jgi:chloramphenicol 3-O-phosphotransferase
VQWTVSRAVANGLITEHLPFAVTSKGGKSSMSIEFQAFWEAVIGVLLLAGAGVLIASNSAKEVHEIYVFAAVLVLESLPFMSAVAIAILENSRSNDFVWWRNTMVRTAELIGLRPVAMPAITVAQPVPSEVPREAS